MLKKNFVKYKLVFCVCVLSCFSAKTQTDTAFQRLLDAVNLDEIFGTGADLKKSSFKIQTSYLTNSVYGGRKDTTTLYPYFTPSFEYNHKSGIYASCNLSFLANDSSRLDATNIELGYTSDTLGKFSFSGYVNKSFYNSKSQNVQSDVGWTVGATLNFDANIVNISASPSLMIGSGKDFALSVAIDKLINLKEDTSYTLSINPNISTYFGGTGFYQSRNTKAFKNIIPSGINLTQSSQKKFQMLSFEINLPIYFDATNWGIFINTTYAIPVNPVVVTNKITKPNGQNIPTPYTFTDPRDPNKKITIPASTTEKISNSFYAEFGVYYKF